MTLYLEVFVVDAGTPYRHKFGVRDLTVEEFDPKEHWNYKFMWPDIKEFVHEEPLADQVRVWYIVDFSEEERQQLIDMGKLGTASDLPNKTEVTYEGNQ